MNVLQINNHKMVCYSLIILNCTVHHVKLCNKWQLILMIMSNVLLYTFQCTLFSLQSQSGSIKFLNQNQKLIQELKTYLKGSIKGFLNNISTKLQLSNCRLRGKRQIRKKDNLEERMLFNLSCLPRATTYPCFRVLLQQAPYQGPQLWREMMWEWWRVVQDTPVNDGVKFVIYNQAIAVI